MFHESSLSKVLGGVFRWPSKFKLLEVVLFRVENTSGKDGWGFSRITNKAATKDVALDVPSKRMFTFWSKQTPFSKEIEPVAVVISIPFTNSQRYS